ncbi:ankyrin-3 isoform X2 [Eurytemora carolleeae]|nr:ankyrin-3 isoform X2 [Eurytemora carolleeae]|eukprot:XP_023343220.1 ankyrin-3-like isoform X2 [Eurytemora affinis]
MLELYPQLINKPYGHQEYTLLHSAVQFNNKKGVSDLIKFGADLNKTNHAGQMPIHNACILKNLEILRLLLDAGANVHAPNKNGDLPIHLAVGDLQLVKILKMYGADTSATGYLGNTCLHYAAEADNIKSLQYFVEEEGLSPNLRNILSETPLHLLAYNIGCGKPVDCGAYLLEEGGDLNARTEWGDTPIHYAALRGSGEILRFLAEKGADLTQVSNISPIQVFEKYGLPLEDSEDLGLTLLCKVAKSTCIVKTTYILDKIMEARHQVKVNEYLKNLQEVKARKVRKVIY